MNKQIGELIAISRYYGENPQYVIAGGGNTSWKDERELYIKASGVSLADIDENGFCILDRKKLAALADTEFSPDALIREEQVKTGLLNCRINTGSNLRPSVETSLHDLFRYSFVVHTHPTLVNGLMCSMEAETGVSRLFGNRALYIPYSDPGFVLFSLIRAKISDFRERYRIDPQLVFIQNHGIFVAADTIAEIKEIYSHVEATLLHAIEKETLSDPGEPSEMVSDILPAVRMMLSGDKMKVARAFNSRSVAPFTAGRAAFSGIARPFTPDQIVYCLSEYLFIEATPSRDDTLEAFRSGIDEFRKRKGTGPKVIFMQKEGVIVAEDSPVSLDYLENLVNDFTRIALLTRNFGGPHPMTGSQIAFIENWEVENYRKKISLGEKPQGRVENKVVVITGGAQGFGAGIAERMMNEGANVVIADLNEQTGELFCEQLNRSPSKNRAYFLKVDVSIAASVQEMVRKTVLHFGGLDVMISNAGILRAGGLEDMSPEIFERMTRINYQGYFHCAKYAAKVMKLQHSFRPDYFMDIVQINSKSGLKGSNRNFAYAGGKFGGIGLTQSFALELMPHHIKVNSVCPGNFFDGPLWSDPDNGLFVQYLKTGKIPGAKSLEDVRHHYEAQVPAGRGCLPSDVARAIFYVIEQEYETGQAVPVTGGQEMLN